MSPKPEPDDFTAELYERFGPRTETETIQAGTAPRTRTFQVPRSEAALLSKPTTDKGALQRAVWALYLEHEADDELPTGGRFLWYELTQRGVVDKTKARGHPGVAARGVDQYVSEALTHLRETGLVPWTAIVDDTRDTSDWTGYPTLTDGMHDFLDAVQLDPWHGVPPLILCESRQTAAVLAPDAREYRALVSGIGGQVHGHLVVDVVQRLVDGMTILWLGDHDLSGEQIQANATRIIEEHSAVDVEIRRLALTQAQVRQYDLEPIRKRDRRYADGRTHDAVELEALGQRRIRAVVRRALARLLPEPLADVHVREERERAAISRRLDGAR